MPKNHRKPINKYAAGSGKKNEFESLSETYRRLSPYLNIGYVLAGSVLLFTWLGVILDKQWSTKPWLTVGGAFLGIFSGFYHFIKTILNEQKKQSDQPKNNQDLK